MRVNTALNVSPLNVDKSEKKKLSRKSATIKLYFILFSFSLGTVNLLLL